MIYRYAKKPQFILMIVCGLIASLQTILTAYMVQTLTNFASRRSWNHLTTFLLIIIVGFLITFFASLVFNHLKTNIIMQINTYLRKNIFGGMLKQPNDKNTDSLGFLTNDFKLLEENRFTAQVEIIMQGFSLIFALTYALWVNWLITILFLIGSFIPMLISSMFQNKIKQASQNWTRANSNYINQTKNFLAGAETFKLYHAINQATNKNLQVTKKLEAALQKMNVVSLDAQSWIQIMANLVTFLVPFLVGIYLVIIGKTTLGALFAIVQLANNFVNPILVILDDRNKLSTTKEIVERVNHYLDISKDKISKQDQPIFKDLNFKDISLTIKNQKLVSNLNINLQKYSKQVLIGPSGIGKSTLLRFMISGQNGIANQITLNGEKIAAGSFPDIFAYASQKPVIFADSLWFNLTLDKDISQEKVEQVCEKLDLMSIINKKGWDYQLGGDADKLSSGQLARIELARAILTKRPILLLDEFNASLDKNTSTLIHDYLLHENLTFLEVIHHYNEADLEQYDQIIDLNNYLV